VPPRKSFSAMQAKYFHYEVTHSAGHDSKNMLQMCSEEKKNANKQIIFISTLLAYLNVIERRSRSSQREL
jgi:hypothetical protein